MPDARSCVAESLRIDRASTAEDLAAVRGLCWDYRSFLLGLSETDREITETFYPEDRYAVLMADLPRLHARPRGEILLARRDGAPVACGMSHALDDRTCEIKRVFVAEPARGAGIAAALCTALMDRARADGFSRVVLDTSRSLTAARRLYLRLGFVPRGPYQPIPEAVLPALLFFEAPLGDG